MRNAEPPQSVFHSPVLELVVTPDPYHFNVVERATGTVLLRHRATGWRTGASIFSRRNWAASTTDVQLDRERVTASLRPDSRRSTPLDLSFQFVAPEILKVGA